MNITDIRTCDLKPYENNPRLNEDAVDLVAASIEEFGFKQPIVVDKDLLKSILGGCKDTTILDEKKPTKSDLHPTMKPIPLIARQIKNSSRTGENVLDLFGGSGSTLMACEQLGRRCFMMEYDPHYADVIIKRWEDYTGEQAELIEDAG